MSASQGPGGEGRDILPVAARPMRPEPIDVGRVERGAVEFENWRGEYGRPGPPVPLPPDDRIRGKPKSLRVDNGPEFAGRLLDHWASLNKVKIDFSRPGKPTDNTFIEAFNARLRAECLNASWFLFLADARDRIEAWRVHYNEERPTQPWAT